MQDSVIAIYWTRDDLNELAQNYLEDSNFEFTDEDIEDIRDTFEGSPCLEYLCEDLCDIVFAVTNTYKKGD